jgi:hypothetical protein
MGYAGEESSDMIRLVREKSFCIERKSIVEEGLQSGCYLAVVYLLKNAAKTEALYSSYHKRRPEYKLLFKKEYQFFPRHAASLFASEANLPSEYSLHSPQISSSSLQLEAHSCICTA